MSAIRRISVQLLMVAGVTCAALLAALPSHASLIIEVDENGCATGVLDQTPQPNCPEQTACRNRGGQVVWMHTVRDSDFSITFADTSLFANWGGEKCKSKPAADGAIRCRISDDAEEKSYKYDVGTTTECAPLDPYIRVRR